MGKLVNDDELYEIASEMGSPHDSLNQHVVFLAEKTNTQTICVTKGMHGAVLFHQGSWYHNSGYKIKVINLLLNIKNIIISISSLESSSITSILYICFTKL